MLQKRSGCISSLCTFRAGSRFAAILPPAFSKNKQLPHYYSFFIINFSAYRLFITERIRKGHHD
nr:MAG TPA_asm: hypothetical protein [Caudoviricetes sp.]